MLLLVFQGPGWCFEWCQATGNIWSCLLLFLQHRKHIALALMADLLQWCDLTDLLGLLIDSPSTHIYSREALVTWLTWWCHVSHSWVWWLQLSDPPLDQEPMCVLHLSLAVPGDMFHWPIELEIAHLFIPAHVHLSCFISGSQILHSLDVLWWCISWTYEYLYDVHAHHDVHIHVTL